MVMEMRSLQLVRIPLKSLRQNAEQVMLKLLNNLQLPRRFKIRRV